jgi:hypothetical protein
MSINTITDEAAIIDLLNTRTNAEIVSTTTTVSPMITTGTTITLCLFTHAHLTQSCNA